MTTGEGTVQKAGVTQWTQGVTLPSAYLRLMPRQVGAYTYTKTYTSNKLNALLKPSDAGVGRAVCLVHSFIPTLVWSYSLSVPEL